jgi:hypothetical protein
MFQEAPEITGASFETPLTRLLRMRAHISGQAFRDEGL